MAQRISRKELKHDEIQEAAFDIGHWIEEHWKGIAQSVAALAVLGALVAGGFWWTGRKRAELEAALADAQKLYTVAADGGFISDDDLSAALYAFEDLASRAGDTNVGKVAQYYQAATLEHLLRDQEAIEVLEALTGSGGGPETVRGQAVLLLASLYARTGSTDQAIERLEAAAAAEEGPVPPEQALIELGRIHWEQGDVEAARAAWQRVVDEYPQSAGVTEARQLLNNS